MTLSTLLGFVRGSWRVFRAFLRAVLNAPPIVRVVVIPALFLLLWLGGNWVFHAFNKPTEIFFPLDRSLHKRPIETWRQYESLFREHATAVITPEFLAALAQVEGGGNPVARTYWRWELNWNPLELYRPASSAVGMYQITDGTFQEAKRYCIHDHEVVEDGPWHDLQSCWFNVLYTRVIPSHAIELTSALLDRQVRQAIEPRRPGAVPLRKKQNLAAVIHLCGFGAGRAYAAHRFRLTPRQRCGDHDVKNYLARINELKFEFAKPAAGDKTIRQER
ncbi:MAG: transglycosylase SLT domain-containing protein [Nitrospirales bacterium]|nr:transglycosylase SLT domain-containing protein [Nitrospirales bacterium]